MIPAEACPGTFVTLKGACGKTTTTTARVKLELTDFKYIQLLRKGIFYLLFTYIVLVVF
jgi:hypothetical protein